MKQRVSKDRTSRRYFIQWAVFLVGVILLVAMVVGTAENNRHRQRQKTATLEKLGTVRATLEGELNGELLLSRSLITTIVLNSGIDEETFLKTASHVYEESKHIQNIGLAKGTVVEFVYPLEGNEVVIGLDYTKTPAQWASVKNAIENRKTIVTGPVNLVQGGVGLIGRTPIYLNRKDAGVATAEYFGLLSVVIDISSLLTSAGLMDVDLPLTVAIRGQEGQGTGGDVFYGPKELFTEEAVTMEVTFFDNSWTITAEPRNGWDKRSPLTIYYRFAFLGGCLMVLLLLALKDREAQLRLHSEKKLVESEAMFRVLVENQTDLLVKVDMDGRFLFASPSYCKTFDRTEEQLLGMSFMPLVHEEDREPTAEAMKQLFTAPFEAYVEQRAMTANGWRWFAWQDTAELDAQGRVVAIHGLGRDITDKKMAETALEEEKEKFRILVEESPFGISLISKSGAYEYVNPKFVEIFGYALADIPTGKVWFQKAFPDSERQAVVNAWTNDILNGDIGVARPRAFNVLAKDGTQKHINFSPVTMSNGAQLLLYEDITLQRQLETRLAHSAKMEAVGTLAGGVAHDFNNLLQAITGYSDLALDETESSSPAFEHINMISKAATSGSELVKNLLSFSRREKPDLKPVDINGLVESALDILARVIPKMMEIKPRLIDGLWSVSGDFTQLEQVVINLGTNARDAMPEGGPLIIETKNVTVDQTLYEKQMEVPPGDYVMLTVSDSGKGIGKETANYIFDPFFTTKGVGEGTGLGLSSAYGIVKNHGGHMTCESTPGEGTTFSIYLPALHLVKELEVAPSKPVYENLSGTETLLLVDDEKPIIDMARIALLAYGYQILTANSGEEALEIYKKYAGTISLVIMDLGMPGMGGQKCLAQLKELEKDLKVIVATGYSVATHGEDVLRDGAAHIINKPYSLKVLAQVVRNVLDS